ncbi:similar to Saccharomyces cerevisiae YPL097W MSY1 Mitochondrial tyrosyl-tRNA synthetase [Maudiozyma barnettii]|uniref:Tyrosine--tRNA ligase n=1 Tax=Maudiozyma barnettii TaxID=61262 RepID=A0A8H2ZHI0_9SACH|nr:tyrosine--tRNA ligase MSY1 [Kazachstania barnettii]CAB4255789.1 similar to Saccharomyces cerevisiae YPL097W MSY1 Mitochondrial tyrosyl-tRNA synthetase [Kazachstania barnettii]CAD1784350.1 similar to Saccharomyces cerevisiae YPL097W MSY1 Mitochondrial tyrosyl-tRNA synthetase [Kazachstania barnettii]
MLSLTYSIGSRVGYFPNASRNILKRFSSNSTGTNVLDLLRGRGLISQISAPEEVLASKILHGDKLKMYCGVDPTAKSIHLGNLVPMMLMLNFYVRGHDIVNIVGGATGAVGDPSGRSTERKAMNTDTRLDNVSRITLQLERFFKNGLTYYEDKYKSDDNEVNKNSGVYTMTNNYNWWKDVKMIEFLSQYGKYIRIQSMLSRDSVSSRLSSQGSLGFNEFTYQILQAYDFYHLYRNENTTIQIGGNDQWGNITAGIDLINRVEQNSSNVKKNPPFAITVPLLTTSNGQKFGKSAGNAIFLDEEINTPYDIYQFFLNTTDADVERFLKIFTLMPLNQIVKVVNKHNDSPQLHYGQSVLAKEVTELIHGTAKANDAETISRVLFGNDIIIEDSKELKRIFSDARILKQTNQESDLVTLISELMQCSKAEAKRKIVQGGVYLGVNRVRVVKSISDWAQYLIGNEILLIRIGKQKCFVVEMTA